MKTTKMVVWGYLSAIAILVIIFGTVKFVMYFQSMDTNGMVSAMILTIIGFYMLHLIFPDSSEEKQRGLPEGGVV
jgi:hypothetical protein